MFEESYISFFTELEQNNNSAWFSTQKERYQSDVKEPFAQFFNQIIKDSCSFDPLLCDTDASRNIFRLEMNNAEKENSHANNRYKLYFSSKLSPNGRNDLTEPYYIIKVGPKIINVGFCVPALSSRLKKQIRNYLGIHKETYISLTQEEQFKKYFCEIFGETANRIPKELVDIHLSHPFTVFNTWSTYSEIDPALISSPSLKEEILKRMEVLYPIMDFFRKAQ